MAHRVGTSVPAPPPPSRRPPTAAPPPGGAFVSAAEPALTRRRHPSPRVTLELTLGAYSVDLGKCMTRVHRYSVTRHVSALDIPRAPPVQPPDPSPCFCLFQSVVLSESYRRVRFSFLNLIWCWKGDGTHVRSVLSRSFVRQRLRRWPANAAVWAHSRQPGRLPVAEERGCAAAHCPAD